MRTDDKELLRERLPNERIYLDCKAILLRHMRMVPLLWLTLCFFCWLVVLLVQFLGRFQFLPTVFYGFSFGFPACLSLGYLGLIVVDLIWLKQGKAKIELQTLTDKKLTRTRGKYTTVHFYFWFGKQRYVLDQRYYYHWCRRYGMEAQELYHSAKQGEAFYTVTLGGKLLTVYSARFFELPS